MVSRKETYNVKITYKVLFHIPTFQGIGLKVNILKNWKEKLKKEMFDLSLESWNVGMRMIPIMVSQQLPTMASSYFMVKENIQFLFCILNT